MKFKTVLAIIWLCASQVNAQTVIIDGDTLRLGETTYRINGIDAPEAGQSCNTERGKKWRCGDAATNALYEYTRGKHVKCKKIETDGYGRVVARCAADGEDLAELLVAHGMAWAFLKFSDEYEPAQNKAKKAKLGIWRGENKPAWQYRSDKWAKATQNAPEGCPIKGNITKSGKIYHPPWSPWYNRTRINTAKGERWFCDEAEALKAGWRAPKWK